MIKIMPKGIGKLYYIQMAITFSYAVIYSSLSLYLTKKIGFSVDFSAKTIGLFLAFNYTIQLLSGYISGRFLSNRSLMVISIVCQIIGFYLLSLNNNFTLYLGLCFFVIGCGINSTCYQCILVSRFGNDKLDSKKRESASFISYCFMNIGFLLGFTISGHYEAISNYNNIFIIGNVFNVIAIMLIYSNWDNIKDTDTVLSTICNDRLWKKRVIGVTCLLLCIPTMMIGFKFPTLSSSFVVLVGLAMFVYMYFKARSYSDINIKKNIYSFITLSLASVVFWMIYFVGPMSVSVFVKYNTDTHIWGYDIQPQWFNNINAAITICGAPLLAYVYQQLGKRRINVSETISFSIAILLISFSFFSLSEGVNHSMSNGMVASSWVVIHYVLQSAGELFIGPIGFAMVGRLAPPNLRGLMMGIFMISSGISASLASYFSSFIKVPATNTPDLTNSVYQSTFFKLGETGIVMAVILLTVSIVIYKTNKRASLKLNLDDKHGL